MLSIVLIVWYSLSTFEGMPVQSVLKREFRDLLRRVCDKSAEQKIDPPTSLVDALRVVKTDWKGNDTYDIAFRHLLSGVDPWGKTYIYKVDQSRRSISLLSCGPDQRDDSGGGDDIAFQEMY